MAKEALSPQAQAAYMLTLADLADGRVLIEVNRELHHARSMGDTETVKGMERALKEVGDGTFTMAADKLDEQLRRAVERFLPTRPHHGHGAPLIRIELHVEAPWMKSVHAIKLNLGYADMLRAFAPMPREADLPDHLGQHVVNIREEVMKRRKQREEFAQVVTNELMRGIRTWLQAQDPVRGIFPEHVNQG